VKKWGFDKDDRRIEGGLKGLEQWQKTYKHKDCGLLPDFMGFDKSLG
jgi:hypothetical protein